VDGDNKPTRVGKRVNEEGRNVRVARRTGKDL
jgi:large subunit ribosomal protein L24